MWLHCMRSNFDWWLEWFWVVWVGGRLGAGLAFGWWLVGWRWLRLAGLWALCGGSVFFLRCTHIAGCRRCVWRGWVHYILYK
jgi:hypothetical protein